MKYGLLTFKEPERDISKKIVHIDMDAFYAAVEIRDNPDLKGKPVIIARHPKDTHGRGVVTTANYEARKFGVHSAMSAQKAYELCPQGIFVPGRHEVYREVSAQIHEIYRRYTPLIEPVSLDEAYLDVTENKLDINSGTIIAKMIQQDIYRELGLTCSAGVSYNKFIAKLASDYQKPAGFTCIEPEQALEFLHQMPIKEYHGVGIKTQERMKELEISTGADLYEWSEYDLVQEFGKMGRSLYRKVRGIHDTPVRPYRPRKSIGKEHTFGAPLRQVEQVEMELRSLAESVTRATKKHQQHGKTVVLKVRSEDYETITKRKTFPFYIEDEFQLYQMARDIWEEVGELDKGIRLLGITITSLDSKQFENIRLDLWPENEMKEKGER